MFELSGLIVARLFKSQVFWINFWLLCIDLPNKTIKFWYHICGSSAEKIHINCFDGKKRDSTCWRAGLADVAGWQLCRLWDRCGVGGDSLWDCSSEKQQTLELKFACDSSVLWKASTLWAASLRVWTMCQMCLFSRSVPRSGKVCLSSFFFPYFFVPKCTVWDIAWDCQQAVHMI